MDDQVVSRLKGHWAFFFGPVVALAVGLGLLHQGHSASIAWTSGIAIVCAIWWILETLPIPATSLIPLALFPMTGVLSPEQVASAYGSPLILLMLGGFLLSAAMQRSGVHRRLALYMVNLFGNHNGRSLVFGFMATSGILSMWISNSATVLMLLPIVLAIAQQSTSPQLKTSLLLGIAYAASIGGIGTPIGTPPNLVFMEVYRLNTGDELGFVGWFLWVVPILICMLPLAAIWLTRHMPAIERIELPTVGGWQAVEKRTLAVFAVVATLWVTRTQPWGGWKHWLDLPHANDASVALLGAIALFIIPAGRSGERLLDWTTAANIPWGVLMLFAGGICLATGFMESGLSSLMGNLLAGLGPWHPILIIAMICLFVTFLTEVTSNMATATILLPILAAAAVATDSDIRLWLIPATISCSFAFMLPVATAPNAIVFGSNELTVQKMAREGFVLNLLGALVVTLVSYLSFGRV